ncbi:hypothetical protein DFH94DRAFT_138008 [Russula ochroleuca]|uniref:Secreted protein n=1 Tax=Russula ochroleuca TaxID=152965 RepID=A0A9P5MN93_9AGAM|nr:hypothetical protein DFH94DRAFT_138008 [Russula ochroleuca]
MPINHKATQITRLTVAVIRLVFLLASREAHSVAKLLRTPCSQTTLHSAVRCARSGMLGTRPRIQHRGTTVAVSRHIFPKCPKAIRTSSWFTDGELEQLSSISCHQRRQSYALFYLLYRL